MYTSTIVQYWGTLWFFYSVHMHISFEDGIPCEGGVIGQISSISPSSPLHLSY